MVLKDKMRKSSRQRKQENGIEKERERKKKDSFVSKRESRSVRRMQGGEARWRVESTDGGNECFSTRKGESLFFTFPSHPSLSPPFRRRATARVRDVRSVASPFGSLVRPRATFLGHRLVRGSPEDGGRKKRDIGATTLRG